MSTSSQGIEYKPTNRAFLWVRILGIPFFAVFEVFIFILLKELNASTLQITAAIAIKPVSAIFSPYWSSIIHRRQDLIKSNLFWANIIRYIPFFFFPFYQNTWLFVISIGVYWVITKGMTPAWMELIKINVEESSREKLCSKGLNINYLGKLLLPTVFGILLDHLTNVWQWIFPLTALVGLSSTLFIYRLPQCSFVYSVEKSRSLGELIKRPWKDSLELLKKNRSFLNFQVGFFFGGAGLMIIQPAMNRFFIDDLDLSYTTITTALTTMKGLGFILASSFWVKKFKNMHIFKMSRLITLYAAVFPILIMIAQFNVSLVYLAFLLYGIMQSGNELTWHMSGPVFAQKEESSVYSTTNILSVGLRGVVFPYLGAFLFVETSAGLVMALGSLFTLMGTMLFSLFLKNDRLKNGQPISADI